MFVQFGLDEQHFRPDIFSQAISGFRADINIEYHLYDLIYSLTRCIDIE